ncbi:uncharacterized protein LOC116114080 [Pistacia vera]|uniref:uncharacterized protein LOC116114080 n=1 Tax=Pistacia vera TaxID=55513 RepID=UPI001263794D|nr:uncharacterized protein LOC116114080 [Pistacia vera]
MDVIIVYLRDGIPPEGRIEAKTLRAKSTRSRLINDKLYKRKFSVPLLRCIDHEDAYYVLREIHEGICGDHVEGKSLAYKVLRQGYYWPTVFDDAAYYVRRCDRCQRFADTPRALFQELTTLTSPWSFLGIKKSFATIYRPQANCQVEAVNKVIKQTIKKKLDALKERWANELPEALWSYITTVKSSIGETPFSLLYGCEAMAPVEVGISSFRMEVFDDEANQDLCRLRLDIVKELRAKSQLRLALYQQ